MATKTETTEVIQQKKVYVKSEEILNEMEDKGQLEPLTEYYTSDDDKDKAVNYFMPVGSIFISAIPQNDARVHLLDGSTIMQNGVYEDFANLIKTIDGYGIDPISCTQEEFDADVLATGNCGKFVIDDDAGTIRLPKITTFVQGLTDISNIGSSLSAGLPNIEGSMVRSDKAYPLIFGYNQNFIEKGALSANWQTCSNQVDSSTGATSGKRSVGFNFDASKSNSIYGNSDTVQPNATQYPYYIVLASGYKSSEVIDIDNIVNDIKWLENEVVNIGSLALYKSKYPFGQEDDYIVAVDQLNNQKWLSSKLFAKKSDVNTISMLPSDDRIEVTVSHDSYCQAPVTGYFTMQTNGTYQSICLSSVNDNSGFLMRSRSTRPSAGALRDYVPVRKGQYVFIEFGGTLSTAFFVPSMEV